MTRYTATGDWRSQNTKAKKRPSFRLRHPLWFTFSLVAVISATYFTLVMVLFLTK